MAGMKAAALAVLTAVLLTASWAACSGPPVEPMQLDGNLLRVANQTADDWTDVEIWLNTYYRAVARSIKAGGRYEVPLDLFVEAWGRRFDFGRMQVNDLRLTAKRGGGERFELKKRFEKGGLAGALEGLGRKRR